MVIKFANYTNLKSYKIRHELFEIKILLEFENGKRQILAKPVNTRYFHFSLSNVGDLGWFTLFEHDEVYEMTASEKKQCRELLRHHRDSIRK